MENKRNNINFIDLLMINRRILPARTAVDFAAMTSRCQFGASSVGGLGNQELGVAVDSDRDGSQTLTWRKLDSNLYGAFPVK